MRFWALSLLACACTGIVGTEGDAGADASVPDAGVPFDGGASDGGPGSDAGVPDAGSSDAGPGDSGVPDSGVMDAGADICGTALLCERFDEYDAGNLPNGRSFGPWKVNVSDATTSAKLDTMPGGSRALHIHIDEGASTGSQIKTNNSQLFAVTHPLLYGRFLMYLGPAGSSIHWTMFGASGTVPQGTTTAGANATYLFSAFPGLPDGGNTFGDVYGNSQTGQDCYHGSSQGMPVDRIACVTFSMDAPNRKYRLTLDGQPVPSMDLNDKGDGCVNQANQSWWGPDFSQLYMGGLSFHPMSGPLDLWVDDLVVDTSPVSCP